MGEVHPIVVQGLTGGCFEIGHHLAVIKSDQLDPTDAIVSSQCAQGVAQGVSVAQFAVAVGGEDQHPFGQFRSRKVAK